MVKVALSLLRRVGIVVAIARTLCQLFIFRLTLCSHQLSLDFCLPLSFTMVTSHVPHRPDFGTVTASTE